MAWKWNGSTGGTMVDLSSISGGIGFDSGNNNAAAAIQQQPSGGVHQQLLGQSGLRNRLC